VKPKPPFLRRGGGWNGVHYFQFIILKKLHRKLDGLRGFGKFSTADVGVSDS
jgi:hypothetical protein